MTHYTQYTPEQILEAKNYYYDEALKHTNRDHKHQALELLVYFDVYEDASKSEGKKRDPKKSPEEYWLRHNLNRIEGMLERYFILKAKGRL
jgi:hypothetical protein